MWKSNVNEDFMLSNKVLDIYPGPVASLEYEFMLLLSRD